MKQYEVRPIPESLKFNHAAHVELWDWLAQHPDKGKDDWPGWEESGAIPVFYCFACKAAERMAQYLKQLPKDSGVGAINCATLCPLDWPGPSCVRDYYYHAGRFREWQLETDLEKRVLLAKNIRDLPVNDNLERAWMRAEGVRLRMEAAEKSDQGE